MTHPITAFLARCALHARALHPAPAPVSIGAITLLPHQAAAVYWLEHRITRYGGALLADPPGLGKTFVALAIASRRDTRPLVIAPATLRSQWLESAESASVAIDFISTERLSAPASPRLDPHLLVIIDEAHHLRTASTRRYTRTAELCADAHVLLLTATPIHNYARDVERIASLFHLPATRRSTAALRRLTLRRTPAQLHAAGLVGAQSLAIPTIELRGSITPHPRKDDVTARILRLPPIRDPKAEGHPLLQLGLLHALRSGDAACRSRLHHRIAGTLAIEAAIRARVAPTAAVRRAWTPSADAIQLAMPQLLGAPVIPPDDAMAERAAAQRVALQELLPALDGGSDATRARALRRFARWCRQPVVAFTQFTATAEDLYHELRKQPGIALLSGEQARIASGTVSRREVLGRLLSPDRERSNAVRLLITTDVLSEGLSLAGVATIVHLDLPWTAARIDQRIGRAARIGAPVSTVRVVALPAPALGDVDDRLHALLLRKRHAMQDFDARLATGVEHLTLLRTLAGGGTQPLGPLRWLRANSSEIPRELMLCLVRLQGRRVLLAAEAGRVRAPSPLDWRVAVGATPVAGTCDAARCRLREWIRADSAERELRRVVHHTSDPRWMRRRAGDEALLASGSWQRLAQASHVTGSRQDVLDATGTVGASVVQREQALVGAVSTGETTTRARARGQPSAISLRAGIVISPL